MRKFFSYILLLSACAVKSPAQTFSNKEFKPLHGLAGLWKMETSRGALYEEWKVSSDNKLLGKSYKVNQADTVVLEQVELFLKDGSIVYSPIANGQNNGEAVPFRLTGNAANKRYVFENKEHDYPQRVIYQLTSANSLHARIEGTLNGKERSSDFSYSRVK
jgi:Domain of unknown function (DUF6265)